MTFTAPEDLDVVLVCKGLGEEPGGHQAGPERAGRPRRHRPGHVQSFHCSNQQKT